MTRTLGGSDYGWSLLKIRASNLEIEEDFHLGETSEHPMNGPAMIESFKDKFLIIGGAIKDSTYNAQYPVGCLLVFDKTDLSSVHLSSVKYGYFFRELWRVKPYDMGISETHNVLMVLASIGESANAVLAPETLVLGGPLGRMGDGHHNEVFKYSVSEIDGSLTQIGYFTWNEKDMDTCDTLDVAGDLFFISCGYWEVDADDGTLPYVAKFNLLTLDYIYTYYMGFDLIQASPVPDYYDRHIIPHSLMIGNNIYFYGISKLIFGTTPTNRFPYVNVLDLDTLKFGGHVAFF